MKGAKLEYIIFNVLFRGNGGNDTKRFCCFYKFSSNNATLSNANGSKRYGKTILIMTNKKDLIERRKHKRFKAKKGAFAVLTSDYNKLGQIKDIGKGGLSFFYVASGELTDRFSQIEIFLIGDEIGDDFHIKKIPVRIVVDFEVDNKVYFSSLPMRQLSMHFEKLTSSQILLLNDFLRKYTHQ